MTAAAPLLDVQAVEKTFATGGPAYGSLRDTVARMFAPGRVARRVVRALDGVSLAVNWKDRRDLASLAGQPIRLQFELKQGELYSFQVT